MQKKPIEDKIRFLPKSPGVYIFKGKNDKYLYIGKASILKTRVSQYFSKKAQSDRLNIAPMLEKAIDIQYIVTDTTTEALILEANLIHKHKPPYNVLLKDDKHYPYIKITVNEKFPRVFITRKVIKDKSEYFGPYVDIKNFRSILDILRKSFKIRQCNMSLPTKKPERPCLYYHINICSAPCAHKENSSDYKKRIDQICAVLSGRSKSLVKELEQNMIAESAKENFEQAAILRDRISVVQSIIEKQKVDTKKPLENRDIFAFAQKNKDGCIIVLKIREGLLIGKNQFFIKLSGVEKTEDFLSSFLIQYYNKDNDIPREILLPIEFKENSTLQETLSNIKNKPVKIHYPLRGEKSKILSLATKNAQFALSEEISKKMANNSKIHPALLALKKELGLNKIPLSIECFDISNLQGTDTVASKVAFKNAKPIKSEYRLYKIKTIKKQNDFASMYEVVSRRINEAQRENLKLPDILLLDGGKGQLSMGLKALKDKNISNQYIFALAKRLDEVFIPQKEDSIMIEKTSPALRLIQRIRDEAHRFAITYHKKLRKKRTIVSELDKITGIGPKKRELLLKHFGSVAQIKKAEISEIAKVVGNRLAKIINDTIK